MSVLRWLIPVVVVACLGGFVVGYLVPGVLNHSVCLASCGVAGSFRTDHKPSKAAFDQKAVPTLLSKVGRVKRGDTIEIVVQTQPGSVCALRFTDVNWKETLPPMQFADNTGLCMFSLPVPPDASIGEGNLLICASACLERPFFQIQ